MKITFKILLSSLAILFLSHELHAHPFGQIYTIPDITAYAKTHTNLTPLNKQVTYTLGQRELGDHIVVGYEDKRQRSKREIQAATNDKITYVEVRFAEHAEGQAYVMDGGIGQRFISILVEDKKLSYVSIYGKNSKN